MTDKAYIVANKKQELEVLKKFEQYGFVWDDTYKPTSWVPSETMFTTRYVGFPYVIASRGDKNIIGFSVGQITDEEIVYDGRKGESVDKKYKVTQEFMDELIKWRDDNNLDTKTGLVDTFIDGRDINNVPNILDAWWTDPDNPIENNNRLIAIIQWLNGEDVFEVEALHKFVVRSEHADSDGDYVYVKVLDIVTTTYCYRLNGATRFDTREEAQEWANSHQVVVEIDEDGNEVE